MKKVAVTVEFVIDVPDETDILSIDTRFLNDDGDVLRFEALVNGERKVVATATDYETIGVAVLDDEGRK